MILYLLNLVATFGIFAAVCWRLYETRRPAASFACIFQWLLWLGVHLCISIPMLVILLDQLFNRGPLPGLHIIVMKMGLAVLFLAPWDHINQTEGEPE